MKEALSVQGFDNVFISVLLIQAEIKVTAQFYATCVKYSNVHLMLFSPCPGAHLYSLTSFFYNFHECIFINMNI